MRNEKSKKRATAWLLAMACVAMLPRVAAAETILRVGMTAADIPRTLGQPDQGFEGNRFTGLTMYDALTMWDLSAADKPSVMIPGLATEWKVDDADKKKWTFKLRPGVTFHDGSPFNADAVVWNVEKVLKQDALQFDASQVGVTASRMPTLASASKVDDMTVELITKEPDSFLPINLTNLFMASPSKWQALYDKAEGADAKAKSQAAWAAFAKDASGTGPWKMSQFTPRERLELVKNEAYWDKARGPKDGLLAGLMVPATGTFEAGHPWRGKPTFEIKYDLKAAQKLMQEAGYGPGKKLTVKTQTSASGSGQMQPLPMNEYLQQALAECYFDVQLDVIEWNTLFTNWRRGAKDPSANGSNATNVTYAAMDPFFALVRFLQSGMAPPVSDPWGFINNPKFDELVKKARQTFEPAARDAALAELHAASVDDAAFLYVAHDVAPRAMSPKVTGVVQPKSWFIDFSLVSMQ